MYLCKKSGEGAKPIVIYDDIYLRKKSRGGGTKPSPRPPVLTPMKPTQFSKGQSKGLSECDVDPVVYSYMIKGSQMKHQVLWVCCSNDVHDYIYVYAYC
jgi:hypothetical protein